MRHAFVSIVMTGFLGFAGSFEAQALPQPSRPLTQQSSGLTQNNTSGLSQNLYGRTSTTTDTNTNVLYPGIAVPSLPQPAVIGSNPASTVLPSLPTMQGLSGQTEVPPGNAAAPAANSPQVQGSQNAPAPSPPVAPSNGAVPEAPNNE
jgi:hypothetical protein